VEMFSEKTKGHSCALFKEKRRQKLFISQKKLDFYSERSKSFEKMGDSFL